MPISTPRPAILYGIDTRATEEIDHDHRHGKEAILNNAGKYLTSQALGPKIEWVRQHEPDVWQAARGWYGCHSCDVVAKLTGEYVLDHHTASQCDPLYQVWVFGWQHDWARQICDPMPLPRLAWPGEVIGTVHHQASLETGLAAGTPVVAGTIMLLPRPSAWGCAIPVI